MHTPLYKLFRHSDGSYHCLAFANSKLKKISAYTYLQKYLYIFQHATST